MKLPWYAVPVLTALALTAANVFKAPLIDDPAYLAVARQISIHPLDPYGFKQFWYHVPDPANHVLAPPVLPYWLGLGMRIFGENVQLLKCWLLPFALILTFALNALLRRFARGVEAPALVAIVLSPAVLPAFNFMLDLPELALGLTAIAMFLRALDSRSTIWAIAAGLVAGLACQTKYTGLLLPPVLFGFACMHRQPLKGVIAGAATAALFVAWETLIARRYGESHFLVSLSQASDGWWLKAYFILPSVALLGGVGIAIAFVGLAALGFRTRWIALAGIALALGYAALAFLSDAAASLWLPDVPPRIGVATIVFFTAGWCVVGILSLTAFRQLVRLRRRSNWLRWDVVLRRCQPVWLLLFWLAVELAGYYLLTPFPATRRVLGITIVGMLIVARLASRSQRWRPRPGVLRLAAMISAIVGICYAALDIADSHREPAAIHQAEQFIREHDAEPRIWFVGHWGLQYEAERRGFHPVVPWNSVLRAGDWLLLPPRTFPQQSMLADQRMGNPVHVVQIDRKLRLRTLPAYYGGYYPMEWWPSPHFELRIYRIEADWMPVFDRASG